MDEIAPPVQQAPEPRAADQAALSPTAITLEIHDVTICQSAQEVT